MKKIFFCLSLTLTFLLLTPPSADAGFFGKKKAEALRDEQPLDELTGLYERRVFEPVAKKRKPLTYFWYQPAPPYPEGLKFPLVLVLHGAPGKAYAGKFLIEPGVYNTYPSFILVPSLPATNTWVNAKPIKLPGNRVVGGGNGYESLHDIVALIKSLQTQYPIDPKRVYVMGCSEGGIGTFGAILHYPDVFAAAVPMSGGWNPEDTPKMTKVPVWALHGAKDDQMPAYLSKDMATLIHEYGGPAYYTEFPEMGHECPSRQLYSPQVWEWMFRQSK